MKKFILITGLLTIFFMSGCTSKVEVILLPQSDGSVGKVIVTDNNKTTLLDQAWQKVETKNLGQKEILSKQTIESKYSELLKTMPEEIKNYRLYFEFDSLTMTETSSNMFKEIINELKSNAVLQIDVVGYSDRAGDAEYNKILSMERAQNVIELLKAAGIAHHIIKLDYYGEKNPIIPTADGVAKKENRRVEVTIK